MLTNTHSHNLLYAGRLKFNTPLAGGDLDLGTEASYTNNTNSFNVLDGTTLSNELQSSGNKARQDLFAAFVEYERKLGGHWSARAGLRFEHARFNYYLDGVKDDETSRTDNGFYPSASVSYNGDDVQMTLSYRHTTYRPSYFMLRSSVEFNNPYDYEGGTPSLENEKVNKLSFSLGWKDLQFMADYTFMSNSVMYVYDMYNGSDSIAIFHTQNIDKNQVLNLSLSYSPTLFKIWNPTATVSMTKPYLKFHGKSYNKPIFYFQLNNVLNLPRNYMLGIDMSANTSGDSDWSLSYNYSNFNLDAYVVKTFLHDNLRLKLSVTNAFNTSREKWTKDTNGIVMDKWNDGGKRTVMFSVTYNINPTKKTYKGEQSTDELDRL